MPIITLSSRSDFSKVFQLINTGVAVNDEIVYDLRNFSFYEPIDILLFSGSISNLAITSFFISSAMLFLSPILYYL